MKKAVVLLSGGIDSSTVLFLAKKKGYKCEALIFDYNQRHKKEVESAKKISRAAGVRSRVLKISLPWNGSSLLDKKMKLPGPTKDIPSTYVPARNTIFLSYAISFAEAISAKEIFIGANAVDFSGYPDCRPGYYREFNKLIRLATKKKDITIKTPLISLTKAQIIKLGTKLGVPYEFSWSCYKGTKRPCLRCDSCILRMKGFREARKEDPIVKK